MADAASRALSAVARGSNVVVEAVPGGGKTRFLRLASEGRRALVLTYSRKLCDELRPSLLGSAVECMTFHSLCTKCLGMARDDEQLQDAVESVFSGTAQVVTPPPDVDLVLIDEAQDVRALYVRLLGVLGLLDRQVCIVGDVNQMIYDFDPMFPASDGLLRRSEEMLPYNRRPWFRTRTDTTHRLTRRMVALVNEVFGTKLVSSKDGGGASAGSHAPETRLFPEVEVRQPKSMFRLKDCLSDLLGVQTAVSGGQGFLLLVDRKRGNRPLIGFVNECSRLGVGVTVHGMDELGAVDESRRDGVECGTFWSCKGLESEVVVVLVPERCPRNPLYVALTRATRRLVLVMDPRECNVAMARAFVALRSTPGEPVMGDALWRSMCKVAQGPESSEESLEARPRTPPSGLLGRNVDRLRVSRRIVKRDSVVRELPVEEHENNAGETTRCSPPPPESRGALDAGGALLVSMGLARAEFISTGRVSIMETVLHPTRIDSEQAAQAIRLGLVSRWVSRSVPDDALLSPDLRALATDAYEHWKDDQLDKVAVVALAGMAWNDFDHVMRRRLPIDERLFTREFVEALDWVTAHLVSYPRARFDVRLLRGDSHCRVHVTSEETACVLVVWQRTSESDTVAALQASMHVRRTCRIVEVCTRRVFEVVATSDLYLLEEDRA